MIFGSQLLRTTAAIPLRWIRSFLRRGDPPAIPMAAPPPPPPPVIEVVPASKPEPKTRGPYEAGKLRRDVEEAVTDILDAIHAAEVAHDNWVGTTVQGALWNCDFHFINELADRLDGPDHVYFVDEYSEQAEAVWPVDIAAINYNEERRGYVTGRTTTVRPSDVRGRVSMVSPRMVTLTGGVLQDDGEWWADTSVCGLIGGQWRDLTTTVVKQQHKGGLIISSCRDPRSPEEVTRNISMALAIALTERYSWHVAFGRKDGPRLLLPTSPAGAIALFKDRDKPASGRRAALRHWVKNHYRDSSHTTADLIYVRDHLRGCTNFDWRGLSSEILVSDFDLEKNEVFRVQAAQWRTQRKHNQTKARP